MTLSDENSKKLQIESAFLDIFLKNLKIDLSGLTKWKKIFASDKRLDHH